MIAEEKIDEVKWERWQKRRVFVREVAGVYADAFQDLLDQPRVYKSKEVPFHGGPSRFGKPVITPQRTPITQTVEAVIDVLGPGSYGQKHGHMNSAIFYILDGKGYDIHDGVRYDWEEGDSCIVENGCVHQHFNGNKDRPARYVVFKAKPLFLFFNLLFQKNIDYPPEDAQPGWEDFWPED